MQRTTTGPDRPATSRMLASGAEALPSTLDTLRPGRASSSYSETYDEESNSARTCSGNRPAPHSTPLGSLLQRRGYIPLGSDFQQRSPWSRLWPIWCGLFLISAGLVMCWAAWLRQWFAEAQPWPDPTSSNGWSGREVPYVGPSQLQFEARLATVLHAQITRPIQPHRTSFSRQNALCPMSARMADPSQIKQHGDWWATVTDGQLEIARRTVAERVATGLGLSLEREIETQVGLMQDAHEWASSFGNGGRGIVYTGGNGDTLIRLLGSITALRKLSCTLPVEIWSFPDELVSIPAHVKTNLLALGNITFRTSTTQRTQSSKQYQIKGEAIAHARFTEILYLDSDNVPVRDPTFLFDTPLYKRHGIVLWPDFVRESPANPVFRLLGFDCDPEEFTAESGQVLVNREGQGGMNQAALLAAEAMQRDSAFWFRLSMGDKDTFRYAWKLFALPYTAAPHLFSAAGAVTKTYTSRDGRPHTFCGHTMLQYGLSPQEWQNVTTDLDYTIPSDHAPPLFAHANLLKESGFVWLRKLLGSTGWAWIKSFTGRGWTYRKGNTFNELKLAQPDLVRASNGSVFLTDHLGQGVFRCRGAGTDFYVGDDAIQAEGGSGEGVVVVDFQEAWGGMLRGFEALFYATRVTN